MWWECHDHRKIKISETNSRHRVWNQKKMQKNQNSRRIERQNLEIEKVRVRGYVLGLSPMVVHGAKLVNNPNPSSRKGMKVFATRKRRIERRVKTLTLEIAAMRRERDKEKGVKVRTIGASRRRRSRGHRRRPLTCTETVSFFLTCASSRSNGFCLFFLFFFPFSSFLGGRNKKII